MTETSVTSRIRSGDANLVGNTPLERLMHDHICCGSAPRLSMMRTPGLRGADPDKP